MASIFKRITFTIVNAEGAASSQGPNLNLEKVNTSVLQGFSLWSSVAPLEFFKVTRERDADIIIRFVDLGHHTAELANASIELNIANELFVDRWEKLHYHDVGYTIYDMIGLLAHEIGHRLNISHIESDSDSIMNSSTGGGLKRVLSIADIGEVQRLQGHLPSIVNRNFDINRNVRTDRLETGVHLVKLGNAVQLDGVFDTSGIIYFSESTTKGDFINSIGLKLTTTSSNVIIHTIEVFDGAKMLQKYYTCLRNTAFDHPTKEWKLKLGLLQRTTINDYLMIKVHVQFLQYNNDSRWVGGAVTFDSIASEALLIATVARPVNTA